MVEKYAELFGFSLIGFVNAWNILLHRQ